MIKKYWADEGIFPKPWGYGIAYADWPNSYQYVMYPYGIHFIVRWFKRREWKRNRNLA